MKPGEQSKHSVSNPYLLPSFSRTGLPRALGKAKAQITCVSLCWGEERSGALRRTSCLCGGCELCSKEPPCFEGNKLRHSGLSRNVLQNTASARDALSLHWTFVDLTIARSTATMQGGYCREGHTETEHWSLFINKGSKVVLKGIHSLLNIFFPLTNLLKNIFEIINLFI